MLLKKLVIAEDDEGVAHLVAATLGDAGFLCLRAHDGEEALNLIRTELPDLLVLDVRMPKMDGLQVLQVLRRVRSEERPRFPPVVVLTSSDMDDDIAGAYRRGLIKDPFTNPVYSNIKRMQQLGAK